jgi:hypothetical protein
MIRIINEHQPEIDSVTPNLTLDINVLKPRTTKALYEFLRIAIVRNGGIYLD